MPIPYGSVGDIISISLTIKVQALDYSRGSAAEYQDLIRELWGLDQVLLEVEQVSRNSEQTIEFMPHGSLRNALLMAVVEALKTSWRKSKDTRRAWVDAPARIRSEVCPMKLSSA
jgi:hypothetical protein